MLPAGGPSPATRWAGHRPRTGRSAVAPVERDQLRTWPDRRQIGGRIEVVLAEAETEEQPIGTDAVDHARADRRTGSHDHAGEPAIRRSMTGAVLDDDVVDPGYRPGEADP